MIATYKYRPPSNYLIYGLAGFVLAAIFGLMIGKGAWWLTFIVIFCFLLTLSLGLGMSRIYFSGMKSEFLKIEEDFIAIVRKGGHLDKLEFDWIVSVEELDSYDKIIEIKGKQKQLRIEKRWMNKEDFEQVSIFLLGLRKKD